MSSRHKKDSEAESLTQYQTTKFIRKRHLLSRRHGFSKFLAVRQVRKRNGYKLHLALLYKQFVIYRHMALYNWGVFNPLIMARV